MASNDPAESDVNLIWDRFEDWLGRNHPRELAALGPPASDEDIERLQAALGRDLSDDLLQSLRRHDGMAEPSLRRFYRGFYLLPAARITDVVSMQREIRDEEDFNEWWQDSYVPFADAGTGDYCCLDLDAGPTAEDRVILWYHDDTERPGIGTSFASWLSSAIEEYLDIWDLERFGPFAGHHEIVEDLDWSSDGSHLLTVGDHCAARLWNADSGIAIADVDDVPSRTFIARFSPDGRRFAVSGSYLRVFETTHPEAVALALPTSPDWYSTSICWLPDERRIAALTLSELDIWDTDDGVHLARLPLDQNELRGEQTLTISPSGDAAVVVTTSAIARIALDADQPVLEQIVTSQRRRSYGLAAAWSPDGQRIAISDRDEVALIDATTLEPVDTYFPERRTGTLDVNSVRWSPDGRQLATAGTRCRIWDAASGEIVARFEDESLDEPDHSIVTAWDPSGQRVATGDVAGRLRLWSIG